MPEDVETLTRRIGKEIFARVGLAGPLPFSPAWWDDRLMELSMSNEAVKFQMFRFVDVLAATRTPPPPLSAISASISPRPPTTCPAPLCGPSAFCLRAARSARCSPASCAGRPAAWPASSSPGATSPRRSTPSPASAARSLAFTVDLLGEATITEAEAEKAQAEYLELIVGLARSVNAWRELPLIDRRRRAAPCRASTSRSSCRPSTASSIPSTRPARAGRSAPGCVPSSAPPGKTGPSSTSTWSNTPPRT